jgi:hypothetical protein
MEELFSVSHKIYKQVKYQIGDHISYYTSYLINFISNLIIIYLVLSYYNFCVNGNIALSFCYVTGLGFINAVVSVYM